MLVRQNLKPDYPTELAADNDGAHYRFASVPSEGDIPELDAARGNTRLPYNTCVPNYGAPGRQGYAVNEGLSRSTLQFGNSIAIQRRGLQDVTGAVYYDVASPQLFMRPQASQMVPGNTQGPTRRPR